MRSLSILILAILSLSLTACNKGSEINGHTMKTAMKSVRYMKERLPPEKRTEFEVSYWTLHDAFKEEAKFLDEVDGKTPDQIIAAGKKIYEERKNAGIAEYAQYTSWEDMISKFNHDKSDQGKKRDPRDKQRTIMYKL